MEVQVSAKYPYTGQRSDELSFKKKEVLTLVSKLHDKGWWRCKNSSGQEGLVPSTYVSVIVQEERPEKPVVAVVAPEEARSSSPPSSSPSVDWERRALVAEEQLANLMKAVEEDRLMSDRQISSANERAQKAIAEADASEKKLIELIATLDAERAEWERVQSSASSVWQSLLEEAEAKIARLEKSGDSSVQSSEDEIKSLREKIAQLEREKEEISSSANQMSTRWDSVLEDEREEHRRTALRCTELHDMYESARRAVVDLKESLAQANAENDSLRVEMKELRRKTQRMVELVSKQKKEMEDEARGDSRVALLEEELEHAKSEAQRLRRQLDEARNAPKQRHNDIDDDDEHVAVSSSAAPPAKKWDVHVPTFMAAPPPPPPPPVNAPKPPPPPSAVSSSSSSSSGGGPTCPKCRSKFTSFDDFYRHEPCPGASAGGLAAAISGGVALKKVTPAAAPTSKPGVVEKKAGSFSNFAELAASVAKQRQQRQDDQTQSIRPVSHRGLDDVIGQIRTSQRQSGHNF